MNLNLPQNLLDFWQKRKEISGIYILHTSTRKNLDILLCIENSQESYFERLDFYYPSDQRKSFLRVYPITRKEFESWPKGVKDQVRQSLEKARVLWQKAPCW